MPGSSVPDRRSALWVALGLGAGLVGGAVGGLLRAPRRPAGPVARDRTR